MSPYYEEAGLTIYHGDCRDIMPQMPLVNAIITDPPYGIGWSRGSWDDAPADYSAFIQWLVGACQVQVPHGWCFVFQAMPNVGSFHLWFPKGFRLFAACKNFAQIRPTGVWHSWDPVVFWANGSVHNYQQGSGTVNRDYHVGNVAGIFGDKNDHPCPRPLDTICHLVALATVPGMLLLDPCMGSGTTLVAAKELGRQAIGIEIEERYCEIAVNRLRQGVLDLSA